MNIYDQLMVFAGQLVTIGGGGGAIAFAIYKTLGQKWLDARFSERLQGLKAAQDEHLRHVQAFIDREIHRARRLYDREFDALADTWLKLCTVFDDAMSTGWERYPRLKNYSHKELEDLLSTTTMREFEKTEMLAMASEAWTDHFRRWKNYQRLQEYLEHRFAFATCLKANAIFFSPGFKEKFIALDNLIGVAIAEFQMRVENPEMQEFTAVTKLSSDGPRLRDELEEMIQSRFWSSDLSKGAVPLRN